MGLVTTALYKFPHAVDVVSLVCRCSIVAYPLGQGRQISFEILSLLQQIDALVFIRRRRSRSGCGGPKVEAERIRGGGRGTWRCSCGFWSAPVFQSFLRLEEAEDSERLA